MSLIIVISTGDFQIRWNMLSLSFGEREGGKRPLGLSDFHHSYLISNNCIQHSGKILNLKMERDGCILSPCSNL